MERATPSGRDLNTSTAVATLSLCVEHTCQRTASLQAAVMDIRKFFKNRGDRDREAAGSRRNGNEMERGRLNFFCSCTAPDVNGNHFGREPS